MSFSFLQKLNNILALFQESCFKMLATFTFKWLALFVAADLQMCVVYSFKIDVAMKSYFTHLLIASIAAAVKGLP